MRGSTAERPLVKKGEAKTSRPLKRYSSQRCSKRKMRMKAKATMLRITSLAIMILRRSKRSSATPATGPARIAGSVRAIITPPTARPEPVR
jgi:hypothetical protein